MSPSNADTDAHRLRCRQCWVMLIILALLFFAALTANLIGIALLGGINGWQRWLDDHVSHFFVWRLCLYAAILAVWPWARRRSSKGDRPEWR